LILINLERIKNIDSVAYFRGNRTVDLTSDFIIGGMNFSDFDCKDSFVGQLTDLNIWNKPLTETEIKQFSQGCSMVGKVLISYFS
jgi:hypothetical protein